MLSCNRRRRADTHDVQCGEALGAGAEISSWLEAETADRLYSAVGFTIRHGSDHDVVSHPDFLERLELRAVLPRHSELAPSYVRQAVKRIETLIELKRQRSKASKEAPNE